MTHDAGAIITIIGLAGWIWATITFLFRAFPARGVFDAAASRRWGVVAVIFFAVWVAGLLSA